MEWWRAAHDLNPKRIKRVQNALGIKAEQILFVYYEDMIADPVSHVHKLAQHMGIHHALTERDLQRVVSKSSMVSMKRSRKQMKIPRVMLRRGTLTLTSRSLSAQQIARLDEMTWAFFHGTAIKYYVDVKNMKKNCSDNPHSKT